MFVTVKKVFILAFDESHSRMPSAAQIACEHNDNAVSNGIMVKITHKLDRK